MTQKLKYIFIALLLIANGIRAQSIKQILTQKGPFRKDTLINFKGNDWQTQLPVTILKGKRNGPVFTIVAGIHGYEYPPIMATQQLLGELDVNQIQGTIIVVPIANVAAFYKRTLFINPIDGVNLNNAFPGEASGTATQQIANFITQQLIAHTDVFLDIHAGDANEDLQPFICFYNRKDEAMKTNQARQLCLNADMPFVISYLYNISATEPAKYAFKQATQAGKVAFSIECGGLGMVKPENIATIKKAVYNTMGDLKIYPNISKKSLIKPFVFDQQAYIKVPKSGIFYSNFKAGDRVKKGMLLGKITDLVGKTIDEIHAPVDGMILYKVATPPVNKDETLFCIAYN